MAFQNLDTPLSKHSISSHVCKGCSFSIINQNRQHEIFRRSLREFRFISGGFIKITIIEFSEQ